MRGLSLRDGVGRVARPRQRAASALRVPSEPAPLHLQLVNSVKYLSEVAETLLRGYSGIAFTGTTLDQFAALIEALNQTLGT